MPDITHVAVAVIENADGEVCVSLRHADSHQGGLWEFPGGKVEPDETIEQALVREIKEELDLDITGSRPLITIPHDYQDKSVCLHVRKVFDYQGEAKGVEGQAVKWVPVDDLSSYAFPAANTAIIKATQLPDRYLITGKFADEKDFLNRLANAINCGIGLVQLRLKEKSISTGQLQSLLSQAASLCVQGKAKLLFNIPAEHLSSIDLSDIRFDGFHADSRTLNELTQRPDGKLFSASCHNLTELHKARQLDADFAVLSPVHKTASHPEMDGMGWQQFSSMLESCTMPVYALGGVSLNDMEDAWQHGAQGVAAISAFWNG